MYILQPFYYGVVESGMKIRTPSIFVYETNCNNSPVLQKMLFWMLKVYCYEPITYISLFPNAFRYVLCKNKFVIVYGYALRFNHRKLYIE